MFESTLKHTSNFQLHATLIEQANKSLNEISAHCMHEKNYIIRGIFEKRGQ